VNNIYNYHIAEYICTIQHIHISCISLSAYIFYRILIGGPVIKMSEYSTLE